MPKLNIKFVTSVSKPGYYGDGVHNLFLKVASGGTKSWCVRVQKHGKVSAFGLGSVRDVTLSAARIAAADLHKNLRAGVDPRRPAGALSFGEAADSFIAAHRSSWKHQRQERQWRASLRIHAHAINAMPLGQIDVGAVLKVLTPLWSKKPAAARELRQRIEAILAWARAQGFTTGDNPAQWRGHLEHILPAPSAVHATEHHRALPYAEVPEFLRELRTREEPSAPALAFLILTAVRSDEVRLATWPEIDLQARTWTIPGERMKLRKPHVVPLSDAAVAILQALPHRTGFLFPGRRGPVGNSVMFMLTQRLRPGVTVHGFRSCFCDWAAEVVGAEDYLIESALAHSAGDQVRRAYRRSELIEPRRVLMQRWADYCSGIVSHNVVPFAAVQK